LSSAPGDVAVVFRVLADVFGVDRSGNDCTGDCIAIVMAKPRFIACVIGKTMPEL
jgi:hypothetical protein